MRRQACDAITVWVAEIDAPRVFAWVEAAFDSRPAPAPNVLSPGAGDAA